MTVLVNNAGIVTGKKFFDSPDNMVDLTFKVNTMAHFWVRLSLPPPSLFMPFVPFIASSALLLHQPVDR